MSSGKAIQPGTLVGFSPDGKLVPINSVDGHGASFVASGVAGAINEMPQIYIDDRQLSPEIRARFTALECKVQELEAELVLRRLPRRRLKNLKARWIYRFLEEGGDGWTFSGVEIFDSTRGREVHWNAPPGIPGVPSFIVVDEETGDPELLLANRVEVVTYISRIIGWAPTRIIQAIEDKGEPLYRLAQAAE